MGLALSSVPDSRLVRYTDEEMGLKEMNKSGKPRGGW